MCMMLPIIYVWMIELYRTSSPVLFEIDSVSNGKQHEYYSFITINIVVWKYS